MFEITYSVKLFSPLRIGTGIGVAGYLDNTVTRDGTGKLIVPGSTLKGKTRATFYRLADQLGGKLHSRESEPLGCLANQEPCMICRVFGAPHWPARIHFEPVILHPELQTLLDHLDDDRRRNNRPPEAALEYARQIRTNISIDRRQRTTLPDRLFTSEVVDPQVIFYGRITSSVGMPISVFETSLLSASMGFITHLGGARGRGLGRCELIIGRVILNGNELTSDELNTALRAGSGVQA